MSANVETMFYLGATPWHGLGEKLDNPPTSAEAIVQAGLDWAVEAQPIYARLPDGSFEKVPEGQVVRRLSDGSQLGVVGARWKPVQNEDAFRFFDPLVQDGLARYHTAGSLNHGRTVWILAQIGETRYVVGDDGIGQFLLLSMGHDGKRAVQVTPTPIRVVCANTLGAAERSAEDGKTIIKIAHTRNASRRLADLRDFVRPYLTQYEKTVEAFRLLAARGVTDEAVDVYLRELFPDPKDPDSNPARAENIRAEIEAKFNGGLIGYSTIPTANRDSYWTLYNAVTEYVDHDRGTDANRLNSAWFGSGSIVKERALELALVATA